MQPYSFEQKEADRKKRETAQKRDLDVLSGIMGLAAPAHGNWMGFGAGRAMSGRDHNGEFHTVKLQAEKPQNRVVLPRATSASKKEIISLPPLTRPNKTLKLIGASLIVSGLIVLYMGGPAELYNDLKTSFNFASLTKPKPSVNLNHHNFAYEIIKAPKGLRIRSHPRIGENIVGSAVNGQCLYIQEPIRGDWAKVAQSQNSQSTLGYVSKEYISRFPAGTRCPR
tara:strand:- start:1312 stop:1986 length:675 start_codon:yes stop_codon:yes gene_type:complete